MDIKEGLHINLFGTFHVKYNEKPISDLGSSRTQELLAWLLLNRNSPQLRQYIAFQFWPDSSEKQVLTNLRQVLHYLRKALPETDRYIKADNKTLQWKREAPWILDVEKFAHHLEAADEAHLSDNITAYSDYDPAMDLTLTGGNAIEMFGDTLGIKMYIGTIAPGDSVALH